MSLTNQFNPKALMFDVGPVARMGNVQQLSLTKGMANIGAISQTAAEIFGIFPKSSPHEVSRIDFTASASNTTLVLTSKATPWVHMNPDIKQRIEHIVSNGLIGTSGLICNAEGLSKNGVPQITPKVPSEDDHQMFHSICGIFAPDGALAKHIAKHAGTIILTKADIDDDEGQEKLVVDVCAVAACSGCGSLASETLKIAETAISLLIEKHEDDLDGIPYNGINVTPIQAFFILRL